MIRLVDGNGLEAAHHQDEGAQELGDDFPKKRRLDTYECRNFRYHFFRDSRKKERKKTSLKRSELIQ